MPLSARQLNRTTLARQLLLRRERLPVPDAVRRVVAIQAQEPASLYLALWNRLAEFEPADLDRALLDHEVVRATLIRITLHAVHADDYAAFHAAMVESLRGSRLYDARFRESGLTIEEIDALLPTLLDFLREPHTVPEIEAFLAERLGGPRARVWWAFRTFAPLHHVATARPWSFSSRGSFRAAPATLPSAERDAATRHLVRRYLEGFGPATVQDIAQATILRRPVIRAALAALGDGLVRLEGADGAELLDMPDGPVEPEDAAAPARLMAMWDSVLLAYADRSRVLPEPYRRVVIRQNGDVLPTLLVDGHVAGVWRPRDGVIEATAFHRLPAAVWTELEAEAVGMIAFLADRDPAVYRRYAHWWPSLPSAELRLLGGR